jgi:hypothetical protein
LDKLDLEVKITDKLTEIADLFRSKNGQYAEDDDAFVNFERAGELLGKTKEEALLGHNLDCRFFGYLKCYFCTITCRYHLTSRCKVFW